MLVKIFILIIVIIILYLILIMPKLKPNPEISRLYGWYYAHRGLHDNNMDVPENSLTAFQLAVDKGYGIELDVQITKDKVPIVMHDYNLERACGIKVKISEMNYQQLANYRLFNTNEKIPTLREALFCINGKVPLIIELKIPRYTAETCKIISKELEQYHGFYVIKSFNPLALLWYRMRKTELIRGQLSYNFSKEKTKGSKLSFFLLKHMLFNVFTKPDFISYSHVHKKELSFTICRKLYKSVTVAWTIRSNEEMKSCENYYDIFIFEGFTPKNKN